MKPRRKSKLSFRNSQKNNTCGDRISDFPDSILGLILSYLPTKQAVATSILSKRWRFGWVTIHNLDFCYDADAYWKCDDDDDDDDAYGKCDDAENMKFVRFVNHVLLLHDATCIYKFCLEWKPNFVSSQVSSWITTVITKNVNELSLSLGYQKLDVPVSFFSCVSLRSLKLDGFIFVSAATVFCLPKLTSLQLVQVDFESEETFENLIIGCSVLDDLYITMGVGEFTYRISSTSLRRLTCTGYCDLKLEASSLEYLKLNGNMSGILVLKSLSSLVEADIRINHQYSEVDACNSVVEVVRASNCAKFLTLSDDVMQALRCATISLSTEFRRLVKLNIEVGCCPWSSLRDLIQNSDNLEDLTIWQYFYAEKKHDHHSKWTAPIEVPRCLSDSLKKVHICGYKGMEDEHEMILYMLEQGSVLESMKVSCYRNIGVGERFELLKKIHESPKKSTACEVKIMIL